MMWWGWGISNYAFNHQLLRPWHDVIRDARVERSRHGMRREGKRRDEMEFDWAALRSACVRLYLFVCFKDLRATYDSTGRSKSGNDKTTWVTSGLAWPGRLVMGRKTANQPTNQPLEMRWAMRNWQFQSIKMNQSKRVGARSKPLDSLQQQQ